MCMSANLSYFECMYSVCLACNDHYPPPLSRDPQLFQLAGRGHRAGGKGGGLPGGRGQCGRGKGKGAIVCGHLSGQEENGESPCSAEWPCIANGWVCQPPLPSTLP